MDTAARIEAAKQRRMRLGLWWRLGVVLSVVGTIGGGLYLRAAQIDEWQQMAASQNSLCNWENETLHQAHDCLRESEDTWKRGENDYALLPNIGISAFLVFLTWIGYGIVYWVCRWIWGGRFISFPRWFTDSRSPR